MRTLGYLRNNVGEVFVQTLSTEEQKSKTKEYYARLKEKNKQVGPRVLTSKTNKDAFKSIPGEDINKRLKRLEVAGLYTPGGVMSGDYANLVNYGTTDKNLIARINKERREWQDKENTKRYGTTNINKIVNIVDSKHKARDAMWKRVYGTSDADLVYKLDAGKRNALCQADTECRSMEKSLFNGLGFLASAFSH